MNTAIRQVSYAHSDVVSLVEEVQQEYVVRYGGPDETPVADDHFDPPSGAFFVLYEDELPVAMGGWRGTADAPVDGAAAEVKRMYVAPDRRGRGYARQLLTHLERTAEASGASWIVLETGQAQPEAIALYQSAGYHKIPPFGHYQGWPGSVHLGKRLTGSSAGC